MSAVSLKEKVTNALIGETIRGNNVTDKFFKAKVTKMGEHRMIRVPTKEYDDFKIGDKVIVKNKEEANNEGTGTDSKGNS